MYPNGNHRPITFGKLTQTEAKWNQWGKTHTRRKKRTQENNTRKCWCKINVVDFPKMEHSSTNTCIYMAHLAVTSSTPKQIHHRIYARNAFNLRCTCSSTHFIPCANVHVCMAMGKKGMAFFLSVFVCVAWERWKCGNFLELGQKQSTNSQ